MVVFGKESESFASSSLFGMSIPCLHPTQCYYNTKCISHLNNNNNDNSDSNNSNSNNKRIRKL